MDAIEALIGPLGGIVAAVVGAVLIWMRGRSTGRRDAEQRHAADAAQAEREAHDRITNAPTGGGMSDADRREWLRDIAATYRKHNGPPKT